jgi:G6PDH family F420-dependent oxidoreductase
MVKFGYKLMAEEHGPKALVENAVRAEAAGFDYVVISDHFHPWLEAQGHSPFAWSVLGAIAHATSTIGIVTGLTCPIIRYHPAIVAQAAATVAVISDNRFTLGVGAGERLNEHVVGARWPSLPERHAMLREALDMFRILWSGGVHTKVGRHFTLDHARLYDLPEQPIPVIVGVGGPRGVAMAAEKADGIMVTTPKPKLVEVFRSKTGKTGPVYAEALVAYAPSEQEGLDLAHRLFRFSVFGWEVMSELPNVEGFEAVSQFVTREQLGRYIRTGPDLVPHVRSIRKYAELGCDHIALTCPGPDQAAFIDFFQHELRPALVAELQ